MNAYVYIISKILGPANAPLDARCMIVAEVLQELQYISSTHNWNSRLQKCFEGNHFLLPDPVL